MRGRRGLGRAAVFGGEAGLLVPVLPVEHLAVLAAVLDLAALCAQAQRAVLGAAAGARGEIL